MMRNPTVVKELNCQFQTNRTFKEISLHFNGTSHSVQGFSHCSWRNMFISVCDTFIY